MIQLRYMLRCKSNKENSKYLCFKYKGNKKRWVKEKLLNFCYHFQFGYVDVNCEKVMHEENFKKMTYKNFKPV